MSEHYDLPMCSYQRHAVELAVYPGKNSARFHDHAYLIMGLCGEAGEVAEKSKKVLRDLDGKLTPEVAEAIAQECGDVLWYLANLATALGYTLGEIAQMNLSKLQDRRERNVLHGSGDKR